MRCPLANMTIHRLLVVSTLPSDILKKRRRRNDGDTHTLTVPHTQEKASGGAGGWNDRHSANYHG